MPKEIVMIIPSFTPLIGGAERQLLGLLNHLRFNEYSFRVLTRKIAGTKNFERHDKYQINRIGLRIPKIGFPLGLIIFLITNSRSIAMLHVHTLNFPVLISALFGKIFNVPVIVKVTRSGNGSQIQTFTHGRIRRGLFKFMKRNCEFIAITEDVRKELMELNVDNKKITYIPNGVELSKITQDQNMLPKIITFSGRLIKRKRVDDLIRAFCMIDGYHKHKLQIIGFGPEERKLKDIVIKKQAETSIKFLGKLSHADVLKHLCKSDIFVLPSESEGMSNALLEAMSNRNAVIARDIPANRHLIKHMNNGLLFNSLEELKDCITILVKSEEILKRIKQNAGDTIQHSYSYQEIAKKYQNTYSRLIKE